MRRPTPLERVRNLGIMAHIDAGKTTVTEQILLRTGKIHRAGTVHDGTVSMDWTAEEQARGITITSAATTCHWVCDGLEHQINIIDTPGHVDFTMEVERSLRVLDGALAVFCAVGGVEPQSETVWRQADRHEVPRMAMVNKLDRAGADMEAVLTQMRERLGCEPLAVQVPLGLEEHHEGVVDLVTGQLWRWSAEGEPSQGGALPHAMQEAVARARHALVERVVESDEAMLGRYLAGETPTATALQAAIRRLTLSGEVVPVVCGAALKGTGIEPLLDAITRYLPSPADTQESAGEEAPLAALAFKLMTDDFVGQLTFVRVYSGTLQRKDRVLNMTSGKVERVGRLLRMHANEREEIEVAYAGEIVAILGLKASATGDTLCDPQAPRWLESIERPEPVVWLSVEPSTRADHALLSQALHRLAMEDPSFQIRSDEETGQTLLGGMGELHLEVLGQRLVREFKVSVEVGPPQVAFRETITQEVTHRMRFKRMTGGPGMFAEVTICVRPSARGEGLTFVDGSRGGSIPAEYVPAVEAGVREAATHGELTGYPVTDLEVTLTDGLFHVVDSSERAFKNCAARAFKEAVAMAKPRVLEPLMCVEVTTPEEYIGDVIGDLSARRARIQGHTQRGPASVIAAQVPLAEMFGYAGSLRGLSQGRASSTMHLHGYALAPKRADVS